MYGCMHACIYTPMANIPGLPERAVRINQRADISGMYVCLCVYKCVYVCVCVCVHINIYIYIYYIHMDIHPHGQHSRATRASCTY